jgi:hypothetical protein
MSEKKQVKKLSSGQKLMIGVIITLIAAIISLSVLLVLEANGYFYDNPPSSPDSITPPTRTGATGVTEDGYYYAMLSDGTVMITSFTGEETEIMNVPSKLDGYTVSAIGEVAFASTKEIIKEIHLPNGVTYIGKGAFSGIENAKLYLPSSIAQIDNQALYGFLDPIGIYFDGTKEDWAEVKIGSENKVLVNVIFEK